jgi:hypothetical protein
MRNAILVTLAVGLVGAAIAALVVRRDDAPRRAKYIRTP